MIIRVDKFDKNKKQTDITLKVDKNTYSFSFVNMDRINFREIRRKIEADLISKGTIKNNLKELKPSKIKNGDIL